VLAFTRRDVKGARSPHFLHDSASSKPTDRGRLAWLDDRRPNVTSTRNSVGSAVEDAARASAAPNVAKSDDNVAGLEVEKLAAFSKSSRCPDQQILAPPS